MDLQSAKFIAAGIAVGAGAIGPGIGVGLVFAAAINGISRNPDLSGQMQTLMYIGAGLAEAIVIYALVIAFLILFVL